MTRERKEGGRPPSHPPVSSEEIDAVADRLAWRDDDIVYVRGDGRRVTRGEMEELFAGDESETRLMIAVIQYGIRHRDIKVVKPFEYGGVLFKR
jgi:hypothetical protein